MRSASPSAKRPRRKAIRLRYSRCLPQLVERAGNGVQGGGSITAFYTVLTEGDDQQDPIADAARAILDGHIVLSRTHRRERPLSGHRRRSVRQPRDARDRRPLSSSSWRASSARPSSTYQHHRDLIAIGAYQRGSDPRVDAAIALWPRMQKFLAQDIHENVGYAATTTRTPARRLYRARSSFVSAAATRSRRYSMSWQSRRQFRLGGSIHPRSGRPIPGVRSRNPPAKHRSGRPRGPRHASVQRNPCYVIITVNGERKELPSGATVRTLIESLGLQGTRACAAEVNERLVPKIQHESTPSPRTTGLRS